MEYRKVPSRQKNGITARVKAIIAKYGFEPSRAIINHYFQTCRDKAKAQLKIEKLKIEIKQLSKSK